ncbi:hypothetical protein [Gloeobacter violaceus]|uniref:Glr0843 protein n=1 Tax=Gloeobacter violaceus (strain ATCC 29082 / PCC 7421) TaxID=251221 RepID=Q7NMC3_GLOVI|nr:hypothetical protein [Gloeobacter violaceus]BAC88784.1 glr0843 [Gloeobacter violaceus PCC 7421]
MYDWFLIAHSLTRWLLLAAMALALGWSWFGFLSRRKWQPEDQRPGAWFANLASLQFVLGLGLFLDPSGLARNALGNLGETMKNRELRLFALEHPLQMFVAIALAHLGSTRSRKAKTSAGSWLWSVVCYTSAALLILTAIPWSRPLLRLP